MLSNSVCLRCPKDCLHLRKVSFSFQLQQLAFGIPDKKGGAASSQHQYTNGGHAQPKAAQWNEWQKVDKEVCILNDNDTCAFCVFQLFVCVTTLSTMIVSSESSNSCF